jgi:pimeloyl-ACP methyl ester carboxylesterase
VAIAQSDEVRLWWDAEGTGQPPLVLVQGLGYTADMWFRLLPRLAGERQIVRFDNRGVGRSDVPEPPYSIEAMADDVVAVMDAAGLRRAHVFGVSMGGVIAQEVALRHPARVVSLVLGCTHPNGRDAARMEADAATMLMDRTPKSPRAAVEASLPFVYAASTSADLVEEDVAVRLRWPLRGKAYWAQLDAMRSHGGTLARLPSLALPTLVLHGTADRLVQPANAEILVAAIPGARLEWLVGASHVFWTDALDRTVDVVNRFLADVDRAAG